MAERETPADEVEARRLRFEAGSKLLKEADELEAMAARLRAKGKELRRPRPRDK
jgi:hypothetical protein